MTHKPATWRAIVALVRKDLITELRTREILTATVVFSLMTVVMFSFGFRARAANVPVLAPAVLWVTVVFAGTLGLNRSMANEQINNSFDGVLLAPVDRAAVFAGKALSNALFMMVVAVLTLPITAVLFDERIVQPMVWVCVLLGAFAYAGAGTLIAMMAASTRARDVFLPILLFPLVLPMLTAAVLGTARIVDGLSFDDYGPWLGMLAAFAVMFWTAGVLVIDFVVAE
jgi:heme exporter protein B